MSAAPDDTTNMKPPSPLKLAVLHLAKGAARALTIATEIAVVAFIGANIGSYISAKTIVGDCQKFNTAKVGDSYVQCTVILPKKDAPDAPPR